jgi:copper chaperone NosL
MRRRLALALLIVIGCGGRAVTPAPLDTRNENCRWCRMAVSDARFAAQLVAPGVEAMFFDDIGCLANYLQKSKDRPMGLTAFVADHKTKQWVDARHAIYGRCSGLETPMGSHLIAHGNPGTAAADPASSQCTTATLAEIFGGALPSEAK